MELEASLPQSLTQPRILLPVKREKSVSKQGREKEKLQATLTTIDQTIKLTQTLIPISPPAPRLLEKIVKPAVRPPTPSVEDEDQEAEDNGLAAVAIQQLIRGRAAQNDMYEGKERRIQLVEELRSTHALRETEKAVVATEQKRLLKQRQDDDRVKAQDANTKSVLATHQGENVGNMLDFLSKELVRLQEERRIHAFAMMAERQRRIREAEESGKRQVEEARRAQQDEVFRQVVKVHQATVDSYLEDLILGGKAASADEQGGSCVFYCI